MKRHPRPVLVYDGDCAFCTTITRWIERRVPTRAELVPYQSVDLVALDTTRTRAEREVLWVDRDGEVYGGAPAIAKLLVDAGRPWGWLGRIVSLPPFRWLAWGIYRAVARNRHRLPGGTPACALPADRRPGGER